MTKLSKFGEALYELVRDAHRANQHDRDAVADMIERMTSQLGVLIAFASDGDPDAAEGLRTTATDYLAGEVKHGLGILAAYKASRSNPK